MTEFNLDDFVESVKARAADGATAGDIIAIMKEVFEDPQALASGLPAFKEDDTVIFEDETVSIWHVRFPPNERVPPHDHQIPVVIGVYSGTENNMLYREGVNGLEYVKTRNISPGEVFSIGPAGIHAVEPANGEDCRGIHIYLGELTKVKRNLFHPDTGEKMEFTTENYDNLVRQLQ